MGTVYLAEQREPIRRCVALKVIKLGMDTEQVLLRFENERQALAMMDHPNIARILDAGANSRGRPYFVMEYVEGAPITEYCDGHRMTIPDRIQLFLGVCRAVQHAHQKGVVHRDLKPSNVLVTEQDGVPIAKVIDFGIAKATDKWAVENTMLTEFGQIVGTPEYASPEQADTIAGEIGEASDVYSLGVMLYELLVGAVPFEAAILRNAGLAEMLRILREEEAPPLVRKLSSTAASEVAERRRTDPAALRRAVDGDLNAIVLKALEKPRERRYASVADLVADIQRYVENRPVLASTRGTLYRAGKFLRRNRLAALGILAAVAVAGLSGVTVWSFTRRDASSVSGAKLTDKDTLILADFVNKTGDPVFDDTLRQGLSVELQQSPFLALISDQKMRQTLALMGHPKDAALNSEKAQQICERTGSAAVLEGSIARLGSQYVLGLRAKDCSTGTLLDEEQSVAAKREDVLNALSEMSRKFRTKVGESLATVERHSTPLAEATTTSLEALKAYSTAMKLLMASGNYERAFPFFRRAAEIDPQFAMAYAHMGLGASVSEGSMLSVENSRKAWQLRGRVSERERFFIDFIYDRQVTGNLENAYKTLEIWRQTYPRRGGGSANAHDLLGGVATHGTGRYERAIETAQDGIATDPNFPIPYNNLEFAYFFTDRFSEAERVLEQTTLRKLNTPISLGLLYNIAVLSGDPAKIERAVSLAKASGLAEHWMAHEQALALARSGQLKSARLSSLRAVELALHERDREAAAKYTAARAVWEVLCGNASEGKTLARAGLGLSKGRDVEYAAGLALALGGEPSWAEALANDLAKQFPEDTFVKFTYEPVLRGAIAMARGNPADSVERLEIARTYELAVNGVIFPRFTLGSLHSAYVRGEALVGARRYAEAVGEFQKILTHRGLVAMDPIAALAHLQLGRAFALSGEKAKAKASYESFFELWKVADPANPILVSAKSEAGKLL